MKRLFLSGIMCLLVLFSFYVCNAANTNRVEQIEALLKQKGFSFNKLKTEAEKGLPKAQYILGNMYKQGLGVKKNQEKSEYWLKKAYVNGFRK